MSNDYDVNGMVEKIRALKQTVNELREISGGIIAVERNTERMLASIRVLELDVCDVADIL